MNRKRFLEILLSLMVMLGMMPGVALAEQAVSIKEGAYYIKAINGNASGKVLYFDENASDDDIALMFESCGGSHADNEVWYITSNRNSNNDLTPQYADTYGIYLYKDCKSYVDIWDDQLTYKDSCKRIEIDNLTGRDYSGTLLRVHDTTGPHVFCGAFGNQDDAFRFYCQDKVPSYSNLIIESCDENYRFFRHKETYLLLNDLIYIKANKEHDTSDKLWEFIPVNYIESMSQTSPSVIAENNGKATIRLGNLRKLWSDAKEIEIEYSTDKEFLQNVTQKRFIIGTDDEPIEEFVLALSEANKTYYVHARLIDSDGLGSNWTKTVVIGNAGANVSNPTDGTYYPRRDYSSSYYPSYSSSYTSSGETTSSSNAVRRLAGADRYATAATISSASYTSSSTAVVAAGTSFADALAASGLAGSLGCPVLLSGTGSLGGATSSELSRLGVTSVTLMGGEGALTTAVASELEAMGITVSRVAGADRQATSVAAMKSLRAADASSDTVVVASGSSFADALSIGPWAFATKSPVLLAGPEGLSTEAIEAIHSDAGINRVLIVGGTSAVPAAVESQLAGLEVERVGGADRYQTSALVARWAASRGMGWSTVAFATGRDFPDALTASALVGRARGVLLLGDGTTGPSFDLLTEVSSQVKTAYVLGGAAAVPASMEEKVSGVLS